MTANNPSPEAITYIYAYGDDLAEVTADLVRQAREFYGTLDGVTWPGELVVYNVSGDSQKRAGGKAKYAWAELRGPLALPPAEDAYAARLRRRISQAQAELDAYLAQLLKEET
jgi:hypothetical protein